MENYKGSKKTADKKKYLDQYWEFFDEIRDPSVKVEDVIGEIKAQWASITEEEQKVNDSARNIAKTIGE